MAQESLDVLTEFIAAFVVLASLGAVAFVISTSEDPFHPVILGSVAVAVAAVGVVARELLSDNRTLPPKTATIVRAIG